MHFEEQSEIRSLCFGNKTLEQMKRCRIGVHAFILLLVASFFWVLPATPASAQTACTPSPGYTDCLRYSFTGGDQNFVAPVTGSVFVQMWGASGGSGGTTVGLGWHGGTGGYVEGNVPVTSGDAFRVMVGQGGLNDGQGLSPAAYGFGALGGVGYAGWMGATGGGLTGLFSGSGAIAETSQDRAVLIAGGGGGGSVANSNTRSSTTFVVGSFTIFEGGYGGGGGNAFSGGAATGTMRGDRPPSYSELQTIYSNRCLWPEANSGGGGYTGGTAFSSRLAYNYNATFCPSHMAEGGSSFAAPNVLAPLLLPGGESSNLSVPANSANGGDFAPTVPNASDPQYVSGVAGAPPPGSGPRSGNGMLVIQWNNSIDIIKELTNPSDDALVTASGQVLEYTITVVNNGSVALTNVVVTDDYPGAIVSDEILVRVSGDANGNDELDPGEAWVYSTSYTVTVADFIAGSDLENTASVVTDQTASQSDSVTSAVQAAPSMVITKTLTNPGDDATEVVVGQIIEYTITVENTGNEALTNVVLTDDYPGTVVPNAVLSVDSGDTNANGILDVGETWTYSTTYTVTQADIDAGVDLVNTASVVTTELPTPQSDTAESTVGLSDFQLSGVVLLDDGNGSGTAFNAVQDGSEVGLSGVTVSLTDCISTVYSTTTSSADGGFTLSIPSVADSGPVNSSDVCIVRGNLPTGYVAVSANDGDVDGNQGVNSQDDSPYEMIAFLPPNDFSEGVDYSGVVFGVIGSPSLDADQTATITAGSVTLLPHLYTASAPSEVTFTIVSSQELPSTSTFADPRVYLDADCDGDLGTTETEITGTPYAAGGGIVAGTEICLLLRIQASAAAPDGAILEYDLLAATDLDDTLTLAALENVDDHDTVIVTGQGAIVLIKRVRIAGSGDPFQVSTAAEPGDILEYQLVFQNPSSEAVTDVTVLDRTPAYTSLRADGTFGAGLTVQTQPTGVTCAPSAPSAIEPTPIAQDGFIGSLEWSCPGSLPPGASGELRFFVQINQ